MPFAHRNTINFLGMSSRRDYLVWREKNGFFTALTRGERILRTWSVATGKLLYEDKHQSLHNEIECDQFEVYVANKLDENHQDKS